MAEMHPHLKQIVKKRSHILPISQDLVQNFQALSKAGCFENEEPYKHNKKGKKGVFKLG